MKDVADATKADPGDRPQVRESGDGNGGGGGGKSGSGGGEHPVKPLHDPKWKVDKTGMMSIDYPNLMASAGSDA